MSNTFQIDEDGLSKLASESFRRGTEAGIRRAAYVVRDIADAMEKKTTPEAAVAAVALRAIVALIEKQDLGSIVVVPVNLGARDGDKINFRTVESVEGVNGKNGDKPS